MREEQRPSVDKFFDSYFNPKKTKKELKIIQRSKDKKNVKKNKKERKCLAYYEDQKIELLVTIDRKSRTNANNQGKIKRTILFKNIRLNNKAKSKLFDHIWVKEEAIFNLKDFKDCLKKGNTVCIQTVPQSAYYEEIFHKQQNNGDLNIRYNLTNIVIRFVEKKKNVGNMQN